MTLQELIHIQHQSPQQGVPDWMLGCFRRRCISFSNGESDDQTIVYWIQSRNFTIDLRLPRKVDQVPEKTLADCTAKELAVLANYEGWEAACHWDGSQLRWSQGPALQTTDRWPEEAELTRVGNCMIEFAPSGAYVEDWRLQPSDPGPLIGLQLIEEQYPQSDTRLPRNGGLIICGGHAALVLGRSTPVPHDGTSLPEKVANAGNDQAQLSQLFDFEASVATGSLGRGYTVQHSTRAGRLDQPLLPEGHFRRAAGSNQLQYQFTQAGQTCVWLFEIDVIEPRHEFALATPSSNASQIWFELERATLARYTRVLS